MASNQEVTEVPDDWTPRDILVAIHARQIRTEAKLDGLREYVERIEKEAHEAMGGLTDPDNMMKMAGQMFGLKQ